MVKQVLRLEKREECLRRLIHLLISIGILLPVLSACGTRTSSSEKDTPAAEAIFTAAAKTAEYRRVEQSAKTATQPAEALIATSAFDTPTPTAYRTATPTVELSPTLTVTAETGEDLADFVTDVTIPDGSLMAPNQAFQKVWRLLNSGTTTWTTDYSLIYIDGDLMGAQPTVPLPTSVEPGEKVDVTVDMIAPAEPGTYKGYWELRKPNGEIFGFGPNKDASIWVSIMVQSGLAVQQGTATPAAGGVVDAVALIVDKSEVNDTCPHTFIFTAQITLNKPATLNYILEVGSISGPEIRVPALSIQNLTAGPHPVVFELSVPTAARAWARLHVTQPVEAFSNQVNFSLTCG
jgi:hypothetical protein